MKRRFKRRFLRSTSGAAAVEFGLLAPVLVAIILPMVDLGAAAYTKMQVQDAAEAGAQYASVHGYTATAITTVAQSATSMGTNIGASPSEACNCVNATGALTSATCGSACSDGSTAGTYVTVATTGSYTPIIKIGNIPFVGSYAGIGGTVTLTGTAVVRIN